MPSCHMPSFIWSQYPASVSDVVAVTGERSGCNDMTLKMPTIHLHFTKMLLAAQTTNRFLTASLSKLGSLCADG